MKPLIIANIHHNDNIDTAKAMTNHALLSGIDGIVQSKNLDFINEQKLKDYVQSLGLIFIATPSCKEHLQRLKDCKAFLFNFEFFKDYEDEFKSDANSKSKMLLINIGSRKPSAFTTFSSATFYLTNNLFFMQKLRALKIPIGLNDKSVNNNAPKAAIALGAKVVVKNFTDDKNRYGHSDFMDAKSAADLVRGANEIYNMVYHAS